MKVFISWSGNRSRAVAELLDEWLRCVIQIINPWLSLQDIEKGSLWFPALSSQLSDTNIGVVCLTQENKTKPWILFEAGALAKGLTTSRVCTFLIDLQPTDIEDPLAQFNHTLPDKSGVLKLLRTINAALEEKGLKEKVLDKVFETYWPQFEKGFSSALAQHPPNEVVPPRSGNDMLDEILTSVRQLDRRMRNIESFRHESPIARANLVRRADKGIPSPDEAKKIIRDLMQLGSPPESITGILGSYGIPDKFVKTQIQEILLDQEAAELAG